MTTEKKNLLTRDDFEKLLNVISPERVLDENGVPKLDEQGQPVFKEVTQEEFEDIRDNIFTKDVDVESVVNVTSLFVTNLRNFVLENLQGLAETATIQREIIRALAEEAGVKDVEDLEKRVIKKYEADRQAKLDEIEELAKVADINMDPEKVEAKEPSEKLQGRARVLPMSKKARKIKKNFDKNHK